jgi:alkanesulfonate monooxygenase SsuD/methylene tetrahydromethanopterin reductase-like flavin-dependent oxidoreductase (luciferase family)
MPPGLRFGLCTDQNLPWPTLVERWQLFEALGFDSLWDCDHLTQPSNPTNPYFDGWTLLAALAARTERVRIGVLVSSNTFRHPAILAKAAITVDHVSNGRLELGLGAGWYVPEHEMFGLDFPAAGERVARFREAVELIDRLLRHDVSSYQGRFYQAKDALFRPGPLQQPRPPFMIGAKGPRMLRIAAELADTWNSSGSVEELRTRNQILDEHCAAIGRDPATIWRSLYGWASRLTGDPWASVDAFEEMFGRYHEAGVNEFIIDAPPPAQFGVLERVAGELIPRLKAAVGS